MSTEGGKGRVCLGVQGNDVAAAAWHAMPPQHSVARAHSNRMHGAVKLGRGAQGDPGRPGRSCRIGTECEVGGCVRGSHSKAARRTNV